MGNEPSTFIYLLISFDRWTQPESNYPILLFEVKDWITSIDPFDYNFLVRTCNVRFNLKPIVHLFTFKMVARFVSVSDGYLWMDTE